MDCWKSWWIVYGLNDCNICKFIVFNPWKNGILLSDTTSHGLIETIRKLNEIREELPMLSKNAIDTAKQFSYEEYNSQIINYILLDEN